MSLLLYKADSDYCDFLRSKDTCVPYTRDDKSTRPFLGIVIKVNGYNYYAPLSSPKPKHLLMNNQIDFTKINNGEYGVVNFNNMIPIHNTSLTKINLKLFPTDTVSDIKYKELLKNQLFWCNTNRESLIKKATKLYDLITKGTPNEKLRNRCCNFKVDELQFEKYCKLNNLKNENYSKKIQTFEQDLKNHGFSPSSKILINFTQLCKISDMSLHDINMAYHGKMTLSDDVNNLVKKIGNELKSQELNQSKDFTDHIPDR